MRLLPSGENTKLALVAIASVFTVGLFTHLALNQPERSSRPPSVAPKVVEPVELRHEAAEPPQPPRQETTGVAVEPEPPAPEQEEAPDRAVDADDALAPSTAPTENPAEKERVEFTPRPKRKLNKPQLEPKAVLEKRLAPSGAVKSRASCGTLPNKKSGVHQGLDQEASPPDPLSEFIGAF